MHEQGAYGQIPSRGRTLKARDRGERAAAGAGLDAPRMAKDQQGTRLTPRSGMAIKGSRQGTEPRSRSSGGSDLALLDPLAMNGEV